MLWCVLQARLPRVRHEAVGLIRFLCLIESRERIISDSEDAPPQRASSSRRSVLKRLQAPRTVLGNSRDVHAYLGREAHGSHFAASTFRPKGLRGTLCHREVA